jgi:hypothetical protein
MQPFYIHLMHEGLQDSELRYGEINSKQKFFGKEIKIKVIYIDLGNFQCFL